MACIAKSQHALKVTRDEARRVVARNVASAGWQMLQSA
jgi:hypothetical protein